MARGVRNLTPEQERELYEATKLRERLTAKGLARAYRVSVRAVRQAIERQRAIERDKVGNYCRMEIRGEHL